MAGQWEFVLEVRSIFLRLFELCSPECSSLDHVHSVLRIGCFSPSFRLAEKERKKKKKTTSLNFPENLRLGLPCLLPGPLPPAGF